MTTNIRLSAVGSSGTTNIDLEWLAKNNNINLDYVIYKDEISKIPYRSNLSIIINMASTNHSGTHWTSLYTFRDMILYFDSFGVYPEFEIEQWASTKSKAGNLVAGGALKNNIKKIVYNDYVIQHLTDTDCGQLCLLFLGLIQNKFKIN